MPSDTNNRSSGGGSFPVAFLITFTTYGTWLHGDRRGSVDPQHNIPGTPYLDENPGLRAADRRGFKHPPAVLDAKRRNIVRDTIQAVCTHRGWTPHAMNVRTNHVHLVVGAEERPERIMNTFKSWSTRRMVEAGILARGTKVWTRHGSTRYLWTEREAEGACRYVCDGQGEDLPMG